MDATHKFTGKANIYVKARPSYASKFIEYLIHDLGIKKDSIIADIGSGTGKLSKELLKLAGTVFCVEPNEDMRNVAEALLSNHEGFISINGTAEATELNDKSVDYITVAQAFHWFDAIAFKKECSRILRDQGKVLLIWNIRVCDSEVVKESAAICKKYCPDFKGFSGGLENISQVMDKFFNGSYEIKRFENDLSFNKEKFIDRMLSSSYSLNHEDDQYLDYIGALEKLFDRYAIDGNLILPNETCVYIGEL